MKRDGAARSRAFAAEVSVSVPRAILRGDLAVPAGAAGLVVFAHGSGSSRKSPRNQFVAEGLRAAGMGTLLMDLLTPEEEAVDRVRGHLRFDIAFLTGRLLAATDWAQRQDSTPSRFRSVTSALRLVARRPCSRPLERDGARARRHLERRPAGPGRTGAPPGSKPRRSSSSEEPTSKRAGVDRNRARTAALREEAQDRAPRLRTSFPSPEPSKKLQAHGRRTGSGSTWARRTGHRRRGDRLDVSVRGGVSRNDF